MVDLRPVVTFSCSSVHGKLFFAVGFGFGDSILGFSFILVIFFLFYVEKPLFYVFCSFSVRLPLKK